MIQFDSISKHFDDGRVIAVDRLSLAIENGELTALVGPSGCGKTTSLRMINRLEEPSAGRIRVNGKDIMGMDRNILRRGIGYVMQSSGLFPHRTVRDNIATVPRLLGWDRERITARVAELVELVGLDPAILDRYPHALSGGQQQRVGVGRALAADPPIMLMDEPFAAVDPIVRKRLQDELLRLQARLRKTIVLVTHDIDEALKLGDRIAVLREGGRVAQYASPAELLAAPADAFVEDFLGQERELRRLGLVRVGDVAIQDGPLLTRGAGGDGDAASAAPANDGWVLLVDAGRHLLGWSTPAQLAGGAAPTRFRYTVRADDSLRTALNALVASGIGVVPVVDDDGRYRGLLDHASVSRPLQ